MTANMNHWVFTADGAEVEVARTGPFAITYVDPKDDPRGSEVGIASAVGGRHGSEIP